MTITQIKITDLRPHPKNPRLIFRDDVIAGIVAGLENGFKAKYAIHVRPVDDYFQVIAGHHRLAAAIKIGLETIPCWVEEMDDDTAYMELVKSNAQGELSPLEIGIHALATVGKAKGKRKKGDGLAGYARAIGKTEDSLEQWCKAAMVYLSVPDTCRELQDKHRHLYEMSKAPKQSWLPLAILLTEKDNTVSRIKNYVQQIKQMVEAIPGFMLPVDEEEKDRYIRNLCGIAIKSTAGLSVFTEIKRLGSSLGVVEAVEYVDTGRIEERGGLDHHVKEVRKKEVDLLRLFATEIQALSTMPKIEKVQSIFQQIKAGVRLDEGVQFIYERVLSDEELAAKIEQDKQDRLNALRTQVAGKIVHGNCVEMLASRQGKQIKLLLTDPPYGMGFQSNRRTASEQAPVIINDNDIKSALYVLGSMLDAAIPHLADDVHLIVFSSDEYEPAFRELIVSKGFTFKRTLVWVKLNHGTGDLHGSFAPSKELMIHAVKGRPLVSPRIRDVFIQESQEIETDHPTEKPLSVLRKIILSATDEGDMVFDPFAGTGSTLVAALQLNRDCLGAELDANYYMQAQKRMMDTVDGWGLEAAA